MGKKLRRVQVRWQDSATATTPWIGNDRTVSPSIITSVGFLYEKRKDRIVLTQSRSRAQAGNPLSIPRACVLKLKKL